MSYERFIGFRYLAAKKRTQVVSVITLISVCGVALGVTALIVVLSVMGGFKQDLKTKILGTKAHAVVKPAEADSIDDASRVVDAAESIDGVVGAEGYIESDVMVSSATNLSGVILRGIHPDRVGQVSELAQDMVKGRGQLSYLQDPTPLLDRLERDRQRHIDEMEERLDLDGAPINPNGRRFAATPEEAADAGLAGNSADGGDDVQGRADPDGQRAELEARAGMPAERAQDDPGDAEVAADMPALAGQADADEADESFEMAPLPGQDDAADGGSAGGDDASADQRELPGLIVGVELMKSLQVELGSELNVVTPDGEVGPTGLMPRSRPFRVVGVFKTGMYEYDAKYAYTSFGSAQDFLNKSGASGIEIKTVDPDRAMAIADRLQSKLSSSYEVHDWKEMNKSLFLALELEKIAMFVVLATIILVASFSILAMLIMLVIEKARDIAVLKSMGVPDRGVRRIFVLQGLVIGALGTAIGLALGLGICAYLSEWGLPLNVLAKYADVYYINQLPVDVRGWEVFAVVVCALFISWIATVYPAQLAAKLNPVDGLQYD